VKRKEERVFSFSFFSHVPQMKNILNNILFQKFNNYFTLDPTHLNKYIVRRMDHAEADDYSDVNNLLIIENEALRGKLALLTERMEALEQREIARVAGSPVRKSSNASTGSRRSQTKSSVVEEDGSLPGQNNSIINSDTKSVSMGGLEEMMVKIHMAKEDAIKYGESSREQLVSDISYLHSLLNKAKAQQTENLTEIFQLKKIAKQQKMTCDKLKKRREQDKMIFVEMLKRERVQFEAKLVGAEEKVRWFEEEMRKVTAWARQRHMDYVEAATKMQKTINEAQQETVLQANTFNLDLASELESLRYEVSNMNGFQI